MRVNRSSEPVTDWGWVLPLEQGVLVSRYKRFLADVRFPDGRVETVHCPNSGSMLGMKAPGSPVVVSDSGNPARKLRRSLELVQVDDGEGRTWVGVNTMRPNDWVAQAVTEGRVPGVQSGIKARREVALRGSRLDLLVERKRGVPLWVEVKNTTLAARGPDGVLEARFPDAVTTRGRRHLEVLADCAQAGDKAMILFLVNRGDARRFRVAQEIDPDYADALQEARSCGVKLVPLQVSHRVRRTQGTAQASTCWTGRLPAARHNHCKRVIKPQS